MRGYSFALPPPHTFQSWGAIAPPPGSYAAIELTLFSSIGVSRFFKSMIEVILNYEMIHKCKKHRLSRDHCGNGSSNLKIDS